VIEKLADYSKVFRFLGEIFQLPKRGAALADYAEKCITETSRITNAIAESKRVSVYYAEGRDGLATECHVSVHAELIPLSGGKNVHQCSDKSTFGMQKVSMEQILRYNPQVIISHEPLFFSMLPNAPKWKNIRAVKDHRVYQIPRVPFNWFDRPPSFMRLLGLKWLTHQLYPQAYPLDEIAETQHFYKLFLNVELDKAAAGKVLTP
jgi:iron complex transport system substrate-binding protein